MCHFFFPEMPKFSRVAPSHRSIPAGILSVPSSQKVFEVATRGPACEYLPSPSGQVDPSMDCFCWVLVYRKAPWSPWKHRWTSKIGQSMAFQVSMWKTPMVSDSEKLQIPMGFSPRSSTGGPRCWHVGPTTAAAAAWQAAGLRNVAEFCGLW